MKTKNIQESLEKHALEHAIEIDELDFVLHEVETYIRTNSAPEFALFNEPLESFTQHQIINEHVELQQVYTITIIPKKPNQINLNYKINYNEHQSQASILIGSNSIIPYQSYQPKEIFVMLVKELNKIKARHHILINIFDKKMIENLKVLTKYIYAKKFTKSVRIPLIEGLDPELARSSKLIMWFKQKESKHQIIEVEVNEVLVEYKKPIYGHSGFNVFGKQVVADAATNYGDLEAEIDPNSIVIEENNDKKLYKSRVKGYVNFNGKKLVVDNKVKLATIKRVHESLAKDEANNIEVHISQNDTNQDSIGEGVQLTSETIHVNGHVGAGSILEAVNLEILGATHQDSTQLAKFATINRHKGKLRCHEAKIKLLEGGEVHATKVEIDACLSGTIYAKDVIIGNVKNNLKVYASHSIKIKTVSGENNLFKMNYKDVPILLSRLEYIEKDIDELKYFLEEATRHHPEKVANLKDEILSLKKQESSIIHSFKEATIHVEHSFKGLNTIIFTIDDKNEIIYKTQEKEYSAFYLEVTPEKITLHPTNKSVKID
jgi:hypothetical protein